jgi:hypothetical protein
MFQIPSTQVPAPVIEAATFLGNANLFIETCRTFQRDQFQKFWYNGGQLRSKDEINSILTAMDAVSPGQSARFFQSAKELVDLILAIVPDGLGNDDWMPPYEYTMDESYSLRVI